jgi:GNAT superfamily N-acetyltransferase
MSLSIEPVAGRKALQTFLHLPHELHRNHAGWVPPLAMDERKMFDPRRNLAFGYCDCALWLARDEGRTVGRIGGIINHRYNELKGERSARFTHLECVDDIDTARALLAQMEDWARAAGMDRVIGPMGFTDQDPEGFVVEGFDEEPSIATYHNREYVVRLLERLGWSRHMDYVVYKVPVVGRMPPLYERVTERLLRRGLVRLVEFQRRSQLKALIRPVLGLMNETYQEVEGYAPLDEREMDELARQYLPVIDPRFVKTAMADGEVVGFIVGIPNLVPGIRRAHGRLLPFGWYWILRAARRATRLDLLLGGVKSAYRGTGVDVLLGRAMMESAHRHGFRYMDTHHELESNTRIRAEMELMGGQVYKRYRVFGKRL